MTWKWIEKEREEIYEKVSDIGKLKAEYFEAAEDGFHNILYQKMGITKADLRYVIHNRVVLVVVPDVATEQMY